MSVIDTDVHNELRKGSADLLPYLDPDWVHYISNRGFSGGPAMPYASWQGPERRDQWLEDGSRSSAHYHLVKEQHLDVWDIEFAILTGGGASTSLSYIGQREFATRLASAHNDLVVAEWLSKDSRLLGSIAISASDPVTAATEIDRHGAHPQFVQILLPTRSPDTGPWSDERYHPIWEAAVRNELVVGFHLNPTAGAAPPPTTAGWPRSYYELSATYPIAAQVELTTLVARGVFVKFPELRVAYLENGFAWLPSLMWRLDKRWRELREEVPWLTEKPSDTIRRNVRFSTQPVEEPDNDQHFLQLLDMMESDDLLMFSSDYPHWDFDAPTRFLPSAVSAPVRQKILHDTARSFYRIPDRRPAP